MKVTPMLFKDEMVRAIVDGRKTQTRRIVKADIPESFCRGYVAAITNGERWAIARSILNPEGAAAFPPDPEPGFLCPYGKPGDLIYVRETFLGPLVDPDGDYPAGWHHIKHCIYRADGHSRPEYVDMDDNLRFGWTPSIHMPRWASRLTLKIKSIRLERLQDISEEDAKAEGAEPYDVSGFSQDQIALLDAPLMNPAIPYKNGFALLWQSINGLDSWDANSWVWRIKYEPIMQNVDVYLSELEAAA